MRKMLLITLLSLLGWALSSPGKAQESVFQNPVDEQAERESLLLDAVSLMETARFSEARILLDSLVRITPAGQEDDAAHYYLGLCLYNMRDAAGATSEIERACALDSANLWYKETLANLYLATGQEKKAGEVYTQLSRSNPLKYKSAYLVTLMADACQLRRADDEYFSLLQQFVQDDKVEIEQRARYIARSFSAFEGAAFVELLPRIDTVMRTFIAAEPASTLPHELRSQLAYLVQDWPIVIQENREIIRLSDGDQATILSCLSVIGDSYYHMGDHGRAYATYEQALRRDKRYAPVLNNYAYFLCLDKRHLKKAEAMSRITLEQAPDNATYLDTYGWILYTMGRPKDAKPFFKHAMLYGGKESIEVLRHYATVLEALGETDVAAYYRSLAEQREQQQR